MEHIKNNDLGGVDITLQPSIILGDERLGALDGTLTMVSR